MLDICLRLFRAVLGAAAIMVGDSTPPAAFAMSTTPASCGEFVRTYLEGGLPNSSTVAVTLDVYPIGSRVADVWDVPAVLKLGYPPYPAVAGQLSGTSTDSRSFLITVDHDQLHALMTADSSEIDTRVLGCDGANRLYCTTGIEMVGLELGNPQPPNPLSE
jgi:hypothetical protein